MELIDNINRLLLTSQAVTADEVVDRIRIERNEFHIAKDGLKCNR